MHQDLFIKCHLVCTSSKVAGAAYAAVAVEIVAIHSTLVVFQEKDECTNQVNKSSNFMICVNVPQG